MKIEILGTGCSKCKALEANAKEAIAQIGGFHSVEKVEDLVEKISRESLSTLYRSRPGQNRNPGQTCTCGVYVRPAV